MSFSEPYSFRCKFSCANFPTRILVWYMTSLHCMNPIDTCLWVYPKISIKCSDILVFILYDNPTLRIRHSSMTFLRSFRHFSFNNVITLRRRVVVSTYLRFCTVYDALTSCLRHILNGYLENMAVTSQIRVVYVYSLC